jgi:hypothetical protein
MKMQMYLCGGANFENGDVVIFYSEKRYKRVPPAMAAIASECVRKHRSLPGARAIERFSVSYLGDYLAVSALSGGME